MLTDRGELRAPLVVDALGWRRVLARDGYQPPDAPLSRGLEVHPDGGGQDLDVWVDRSLVRRGYCWSVPADGEQRVGAGSYEPRDHVREPTEELAARLDVPAVRYQGNWFPHRLRRAAEDGTFFVGDSAGHCLPLSGEGIRTAFHFGIACGRELRAVVGGERTREQALRSYARVQRRPPARVRDRARRCSGWCRRCRRACSRWRYARSAGSALVDALFGWYLEVAAPPAQAAAVATGSARVRRRRSRPRSATPCRRRACPR